jgi:hypothetical protein
MDSTEAVKQVLELRDAIETLPSEKTIIVTEVRRDSGVVSGQSNKAEHIFESDKYRKKTSVL